MSTVKKNVRFCDRLSKLIEERIAEKNAFIHEQNQLLREKDQKRLEEWKNKIQKGDKPLPLQKHSAYTNEDLMSDFEIKYGIHMYRSKLDQYKNGTTVPPEETIHCFADFFHVSYDYIIGNSEVRNYDTAELKDFLKLNENSIQTLLSFNNDKIALQMLNAFLLDADELDAGLKTLYSQTYAEYKRNSHSDINEEYFSQSTIDRIGRALSFYDYFQSLLLISLKDTFAEELAREEKEQKWEQDNMNMVDKCVSELFYGTESKDNITGSLITHPSHKETDHIQ